MNFPKVFLLVCCLPVVCRAMDTDMLPQPTGDYRQFRFSSRNVVPAAGAFHLVPPDHEIIIKRVGVGRSYQASFEYELIIDSVQYELVTFAYNSLGQLACFIFFEPVGCCWRRAQLVIHINSPNEDAAWEKALDAVDKSGELKMKMSQFVEHLVPRAKEQGTQEDDND